jgi:hypothetical protein
MLTVVLAELQQAGMLQVEISIMARQTAVLVGVP